MTLSYVDPKPTCAKGTGYKFVEKRGNRYYSWDSTINNGFPYSRHYKRDPRTGPAWLTYDGKSKADYETGFHISLNLKGCQGWYQGYGLGFAFVEVRFRDVVATGRGMTGLVAVAKEMRIVREVAKTRNERGRPRLPVERPLPSSSPWSFSIAVCRSEDHHC